MMLRAFFLVSLAIGALGLAPRSQSLPTPKTSDAAVARHASLRLKHETPARILRWLQRQGSVRLAAIGPDGRTFDIRFRDGRRIAILPPMSRTVGLTAGRFNRQIGLLSRGHAPAGAQGGRALVLEPFATELGLGPNAGDVEVGYLRQAGFQVDQLYDTAVDVNSMKLLSHYNVTYMHTHSGFITGGLGLVATGQLDNSDPAMAPFIQNGSVVESYVSGTQQLYYAVTAAYFRNYEEPFAPDSLVFFNGCNVLGAPDVWQALQAKRLGVLVSWDQEATSLDNYFAGAAFFGGMAQGMTVSQAIQTEQSAGYGISNINGQQAHLGFQGDGGITLQRAAAGPLPATPGPVATATPQPALPPPPTSAPHPTATSTPRPTPTPAPTATRTPGPGPSLVVSFNRKVTPGSRQIIVVRSAPNTPVRFRIQYPDGETQTWTGTTDAAGNMRYAYVQAANKVTYQHVFATVTVEAGAGDISTLTETYRIGWAKIDVSVLPREQAVGQTVSIWVHAAARAPVTVFLHFPSGQTHRIVGKTLAHGWAHFHYQIARYLKKGNNRTVVVQARSRRGRTVYKAQTTFLIK